MLGAVNHNRFKYVRVDLTGGLDSRTVFASITNCPTGNKIRIHSGKYSRTNPLDNEIACKIINIYGFPYDSIPEIFEISHDKLSTISPHSNYLGVYFDYNPNLTQEKMNDTVRLSGAYGELLRPYLSWRYLLADQKNMNLSKLLDKLIEQKGDLTVYYDGTPYLHEILKATFSDIPGRTALEQLEFFYLYYRNRLHFADSYKNDAYSPGWGILQSKTAFKLKNMLYMEYGNLKLIFDIIRLLNPILSEIVYDDNAVNEEKVKLSGELYRTLSFPSVICNSDKSKWELSLLEKRKNRRYFIDNHEVSQQQFEQAKKEIDLNEVYGALKAIISFDNGALRELGCPIYIWLLRHPEQSTYRNVLINKIFSLYYQLPYATNVKK